MTGPSAAEPGARRARLHELDRVVQILVGAFYSDPTWAWVFPDPQRRREQQRRLWELLVRGALRYPDAVWLNADSTATALWIPPGGTELSPEQDADLEHLMSELPGGDADRLVRTFEAFEHARPDRDDFYYLSLLGTDLEYRGRGHGLRLFHDTLYLADHAGAPAYLEASNSANVALYARYGFQPHGTVTLPEDGPDITTMWRDPQRTR